MTTANETTGVGYFLPAKSATRRSRSSLSLLSPVLRRHFALRLRSRRSGFLQRLPALVYKPLEVFKRVGLKE